MAENREHNGDDADFNKYYQIDFLKRKHTVIAVQGTDTTAVGDMFTDFRLFSASIMFDFVIKQYIPFANYMKPDSRSYLQRLFISLQDYYSKTSFSQVGLLSAYRVG